METVHFTAKFDGEEADKHRVPAYDAVNALYGVSRGILIPTHYIVEGKVRHRNIFSPNYNLYLSPPTKGSVEFLYELAVVGAATIANPVAINVTTDILSKFVMNSIRKAVGKSIQADESDPELVSTGTLEAIASAMEPSLRRAHHIIDNGAQTINIYNNGGNVMFDASTKYYLNTIVRDDFLTTKLLSVGNFNANGKYGGAFDREKGRVLPFTIVGNPDAQTLRTIMQSQSSYVDFQISNDDDDKEKAFVAFQFREVQDVNGQLKKN